MGKTPSTSKTSHCENGNSPERECLESVWGDRASSVLLRWVYLAKLLSQVHLWGVERLLLSLSRRTMLYLDRKANFITLRWFWMCRHEGHKSKGVGLPERLQKSHRVGQCAGGSVFHTWLLSRLFKKPWKWSLSHERLQDIGDARNVRSFWREAAGVDRKGAIVDTGSRPGRAELPYPLKSRRCHHEPQIWNMEVSWVLLLLWSNLPCCLPVPSFGMGTFLLYNTVFNLYFFCLIGGSYLRINTVVTVRLWGFSKLD